MDLQTHMQANIGASIPDPIINGQWHSGRGKLGKVSYVGHHLPKGLLVRYRHWKESGEECFTWTEWEGNGEYIDPEEYRKRKAEADHKSKIAAEQAGRKRNALLEKLVTIWAESHTAAINHPYADQKCIFPMKAKQTAKSYEIVPATDEKRAQYINPNDLLIPIYSHTGSLQGIQQITEQGAKFMRGTFKDGLLWLGGGLTTGEVSNRLYIAEGWATGAAIHMRTRNPVLVAFNTTNLLSVGQWARDRYPDSQIIFAIDNDVGSFITRQGRRIENPGKYYATIAAKAIDAAVITPPIEGNGDWCDWHVSQIKATQ